MENNRHTASSTGKPKLGQILYGQGAVAEKQLLGALQKQAGSGRRIGEILMADGLITEIKLAEALAEQLQIPLYRLTRYQPMEAAVNLVPRVVAERLQLVPLSIIDGSVLLAAMSDPLDILAQDEVRTITGLDLKLGVTTPTEIKNNLDRLYDFRISIEDAIIEFQEQPSADQSPEPQPDDAPVIQLVNHVLSQAVREEASDVHVEPCSHNARIRFRVDGVLYSAFEYPLALHPPVSSRLKIMSGMDIAEKRKPQDGRILIKTAGRSIDLRVSAVPTTRGEKIVIRILDQAGSAMRLEQLGFEPDDMKKIVSLCDVPWGVVLATGPTGSGKSTTLYSMMERLNKTGVNIVTVEDPVEYTLDGISQIHVNERTGLTFEAALRSILRQDPDKIMVGEVRDSVTAQIVIRAALTGHLVLSTLHTNDAPSALTRLVEMGVPPFLVSAALTGVIAQRLVRKLCPYCKKEHTLLDYVCDSLGLPRGSRVWRAVGCNECRQGYRGRLGIYEIMPVDDQIRRMILEGEDALKIRAAAAAKGMKTLRQSGINNVMAGLTSLEEVLSTTL